MTLELIAVTQRYGRHVALDDVTLRVRRGDCYGFIGHNGAGKTTAMRVALGLIRPRRGRVVVDGFDARRDPREARARMGGLIETPGFFNGWSGRANLVVLARLQGLGREAARREADELLELTGLRHAARKSVGAYSHGMRQRLGIAQALVGRPDYILLDEPGNGLDPEGLAELRALVRRLTADEGVTVVLSSHQLHEVAEICTRIGVLKQGRLLVEQDCDRLLAGATPRYVLRTGDPEAGRRALAAMGLDVEAEGGGAMSLSLGGREPADVTRALVEAGCPVTSFAPRAPSLEEIYLSLSAAREPAADEPEPAPASRPTRRAPRAGLWRALRYEVRRLAGGLATPILLLLPAALGLAGVWDRFRGDEAARAAMQNDDLVSTTAVTAFEGVAFGLGGALQLAAVVLCGLASQSMAGELSRGTLRNAVLRPLRRWELVLGKLAALGLLTLVSWAVLTGVVLAAAAHWFDFEDVAELLPNGDRYPLVEAKELWPELRGVLAAPLLPLLTFTALGFLAGSLVRSAAAALSLSLGLMLVLDLGRAVAREWHAEAWLPSAHLPSILGDTSGLRHYADVAQGISNAAETYAQTPLLWWLGAAVLLAAISFSRRSIR